jgi:hypothetical protein
MPEARKRPCTICRRWFRPNPRVGVRQSACGNPACQTTRRQRTQANWRNRNPGYSIAWRLDRRAAQPEASEPLRMAPPLNQLPWGFAKDQFGMQGTDFIGVMGALILRAAKDQIRPYLTDPSAVPGTLPLSPQKTSPGLPHTRAEAPIKGASQAESPDHATGVSRARSAVGTSASARAAPPAPSAGVAG